VEPSLEGKKRLRLLGRGRVNETTLYRKKEGGEGRGGDAKQDKPAQYSLKKNPPKVGEIDGEKGFLQVKSPKGGMVFFLLSVAGRLEGIAMHGGKLLRGNEVVRGTGGTASRVSANILGGSLGKGR